MEKPSKQARHELDLLSPRCQAFQRSYHHQQNSTTRFTEEELCCLLKESGSTEADKSIFLNWLSRYMGSEAVYHFNSSTSKLLHGWLILQLGTSVSENSNSQTTKSTSNKVLILNCLGHIYLTHSISRLLSPNELEETLKVHMRQSKLTMGDQEGCSEKGDPSRNKTVFDHCIRSIDLILDSQVQYYGAVLPECGYADDEVKDFVLTLLEASLLENTKALQLENEQSSGTNPASHFQYHSVYHYPARRLLLKLANMTTTQPMAIHDSVIHWARIARHALHVCEQKMRGQEADVQHYTTHLEWLFHMECLSFCESCSDTMAESDENELVRMAMDNHAVLLSLRASRCLSRMAGGGRGGVTTETAFSKRLLQRVLHVFHLSDNPQVKIHLLPALQRFSVYLYDGDDMKFKSIVSKLVDLILSAPEHGLIFLELEVRWRRDAASILSKLLSVGAQNSWITMPDVLSICFVFFDSYRPEAIKCAVDTIYDCVQRNPFLAINVPDLFQALAGPLTSASSDQITIEKSLDICVMLTRQRPMNLSHLSRTPRTLEGLVRTAAGPKLEDDNEDNGDAPNSYSQAQFIAISLLLEMSQDPSNHRILARQRGLLPLLIQHVREQEIPRSATRGARQQEGSEIGGIRWTEGNSNTPEREAIKANIMLIASAL